MIAGMTQIGTLVRAWSVRPKGLIHVGAHLAEELPSYAKHGWMPRVWVEPLHKQASQIRTKIGESNQDHLFEVAVCEGPFKFFEVCLPRPQYRSLRPLNIHNQEIGIDLNLL